MHISSIGSFSEVEKLNCRSALLGTASLPAKKRQTLQRKSDIIGMDAEILDGCGHRSLRVDVCGRCPQHRHQYHEEATTTPNRESVVRRVCGTPTVVQRLRQLESAVRKRPVFRSDRDYHRCKRNGTGFASLFASPDRKSTRLNSS